MSELITKQDIWQTIQTINRLWTVENKADELAFYFHDNMVAITATDRFRLEGKTACLASWKNFSENAKIHYWKETEPKIQLYGEDTFAIVTYYFEMSFDMGGQTINLKGRDMFSLIREDEKWLVVANQFSQFPNE